MISPSKLEYFFKFIRFLVFFKNPKLGFVGRKTRIFKKNKISFGSHLNIGSYCNIDPRFCKSVKFGDRVSIRDYFLLTSYSSKGLPISGSLVVGNNVGFSEKCHIHLRGDISLGNDVIVGPSCTFISENHRFASLDKPFRLQGIDRTGIVIENNVWVGANVTILDGVKIGENTVIAAGSVVTKSFDCNNLIGGVPAKIIKHLR